MPSNFESGRFLGADFFGCKRLVGVGVFLDFELEEISKKKKQYNNLL